MILGKKNIFVPHLCSLKSGKWLSNSKVIIIITSVDLVWLDKFDDLLKSSVSCITNNALSETQWLQATLPIKDGGLGIRRVASLALPAFWLLRQALFSCRTTSVPPLTLVMTPWRSCWSPGGKPHSGHLPPLSRHTDSRHGIDPVFLPRSQRSKRLALLLSNERVFSRPGHLTVATGCFHCPSLRAVWDLMTRQSVWLWLCVLALTVASTSTRQGSIVWYADTRRAVLPDIMHWMSASSELCGCRNPCQ